jgi:hypothetical protein
MLNMAVKYEYKKLKKKLHVLSPECASELYRPSDRCLSAK